MVDTSGKFTTSAKMFTFTLESTHFIFNKCPIYTYDGASGKFSTNSHETDYSVDNQLFICYEKMQKREKLWKI